ncbi:hypothetical protein [Virgibacillus doumboii]|uniref:hypothetical protein n=1 Tax=Virgibacillus doumboii TaxID=2697503 RepID=UPI0013DEF1D0|nr:hypothetical protein [Virgibacillus doumboii]
MNTLTRSDAILKQGDSHIIFGDKDIDFGMPKWQRLKILKLWQSGKSIIHISKQVKRNQHEVFFTLYEYQMEGKIDDIRRAFAQKSSLLVPGKEQLK